MSSVKVFLPSQGARPGKIRGTQIHNYHYTPIAGKMQGENEKNAKFCPPKSGRPYHREEAGTPRDSHSKAKCRGYAIHPSNQRPKAAKKPGQESALPGLFIKQDVLRKPRALTLLRTLCGGVLLEACGERVWCSLADKLLQKGYVVCTNVASSSKAPVNGTIPLRFGYDISVPLLEKCGYFVDVRSGFCDIISSALCKK